MDKLEGILLDQRGKVVAANSVLERFEKPFKLGDVCPREIATRYGNSFAGRFFKAYEDGEHWAQAFFHSGKT